MRMETFKRVSEIYRKITLELIEKNLTVSLMESCTSGLIASLLTDTEGASEVFQGSLVAYSNEIKIRNGVSAETINVFGVYSAETAEAMARCAKKDFGSDISMGITGCFGRKDPANPDGIPGRVYYSIVSDTSVRNGKIVLDSFGTRPEDKLFTAEKIGMEMVSILEGLNVK